MGRQCPIILEELRIGVHDVERKVTEVNGEIHKLEAEVVPIRATFALSNNKLMAGLALLFVAWVAGTIYNLPSPKELEKVRAKQQEVVAELAAVSTFRAVTAQRLDAIEKITSENNDLLHDISVAVGVAKKR